MVSSTTSSLSLNSFACQISLNHTQKSKITSQVIGKHRLAGNHSSCSVCVYISLLTIAAMPSMHIVLHTQHNGCILTSVYLTGTMCSGPCAIVCTHLFPLTGLLMLDIELLTSQTSNQYQLSSRNARATLWVFFKANLFQRKPKHIHR